MDWNRFKNIKPNRGEKIVALYDDGSGSEIFWLSLDDSEIAFNGNGGEEELEVIYNRYDWWAYLPHSFLFFGEDPPDEVAVAFIEQTG